MLLPRESASDASLTTLPHRQESKLSRARRSPRTLIATAAVPNLLGGDEVLAVSRKPAAARNVFSLGDPVPGQQRVPDGRSMTGRRSILSGGQSSRQRCTGADAELAVDAGEVRLDGVHAQVKSRRDLLVGEPVRRERG
jgi:hypothetical protein